MPTTVLHILEATTGGTGRHLRDLVANTDRERFTPSVICSLERDERYEDAVRQWQAGDVPVTVIPMIRAVNPVKDIAAFKAIRRQILTTRPDIIHAHSAKAGFLGRLAARSAGIREVVYTPHGYPFQMDVPRVWKSLYYNLERLAAKWTATTICVSREELHLAAAFHAPGDSVYIANGISQGAGVDCDRARTNLRQLVGIPADASVVGAVGRLTRQKGFEVLVRAARAILENAPDAHIVVIGAGEERPLLETAARKGDAAARVHFLGPRVDAQELTAGFDILAMPSRWEGLPYALLDAMAQGLPIVASRVGGIADVVQDRRNGITIAPEDSEALACAIVRLLSDSDLRNSLGDAARHTIAAYFTLEQMVEKTQDVYSSVCEKT